MSANYLLNKMEFDRLFREIGKEYRKLSRNPIEIIVVGGAAIFLSYSFRMYSRDVDCFFHPKNDALKNAINNVTDKYNLEINWLNDDFKFTASYSSRLYEKSKYYNTFSNILTVRVIQGEYLIATKLFAIREYRNDVSDIIGVIKEENNHGRKITKEDITTAVKDLYGKEELSDDQKNVLDIIYSNFDNLYSVRLKEETNNGELLSKVKKVRHSEVNKDNIDEVLKALRNKNK